MESPTPLAERTNACDTPVDEKNVLKTRLRPKPPTVLSPVAKDFTPGSDDDSADEDFAYDAQKDGKLKGASEQWTRGAKPTVLSPVAKGFKPCDDAAAVDAAAVDAVLDAIDDLQCGCEDRDSDDALSEAAQQMTFAPAPPEELEMDDMLADANDEIESIEDACDTELLADASAAVAAPGGPFEDVATLTPAPPPSPPRTAWPALTRFMQFNCLRF